MNTENFTNTNNTDTHTPADNGMNKNDNMNQNGMDGNGTNKKRKIDAPIITILVGLLLVGVLVGGVLYAFVFNDNDDTTSEQAVSDSGETAAFELVDTQQGLYPIKIAKGIYSCDFEIRAQKGGRNYADTLQLKSEEQLDQENIGIGFLPVATISVDFTNPQGLFDDQYTTYTARAEQADAINKLFSDWDGITYSGSFGLRSGGTPNYPVMDVNWDINESALTAYNDSFQWTLGCAPVQDIEDQLPSERTSEITDEFVYQGVGSRFFQASLAQGHHECSIDVFENARPAHETYSQPYIRGGGGMNVKSYTDYNDYSQPPLLTSLIQTNPWDERKSSFGLQVTDDQQSLLSVRPARGEGKAQWVIACNQLTPESKTTSLKREGLNVERFYANLQPGTYSCTTDAIGGSVEYQDQQEPVRLAPDPSSVVRGFNFELAVTDASDPYITIAQNYHGYGGDWTLECNPKT